MQRSEEALAQMKHSTPCALSFYRKPEKNLFVNNPIFLSPALNDSHLIADSLDDLVPLGGVLRRLGSLELLHHR